MNQPALMHRKQTSFCETWKQLTREGNAYFHANAYDEALTCYEHARSMLLQHFESWGNADDAVAALVVSYLNLADTQQRLGHSNEAADTLCMVHDRLMLSIHHPSAEPALREAARRHHRETFAALSEFAHAQGHDSRVSLLIEACLARTQHGLQIPSQSVVPTSQIH